MDKSKGKYKILLFRGSPRSNIQEVEMWNNKLPCDVLNIRYMQEIPAYHLARNWFLEHKEYDYFVIATDDIIVKPEHVEQLQKDIDENPFPVISGMMNVDQHEYMIENGNLNICQTLALKDKKLRYYDWYKRENLPDKTIFQVKFAGFGLTAIRRDIIEQIEFAGDGIFKGKGMEFGASLDFVFCWNCHERNIPIFVDKRIDMQHLRISGRHQVGERYPQIWFNDVLIKTCVHEPERIMYDSKWFNQCVKCKSFT
jgi:hypothetical protein